MALTFQVLSVNTKLSDDNIWKFMISWVPALKLEKDKGTVMGNTLGLWPQKDENITSEFSFKTVFNLS